MRILTVLAAILLVAAFTLVTVLPPDLPLGAALTMLDHALVDRMQAVAREYLPGWVWVHMAVPLLLRPAWLLPASLGVVAAGAAATLHSSTGPTRTRRRRS